MKCLKCWLQRDLSLKGRGLLVKAEGLSRLTYAAQSLYIDKHTCKIIDGILLMEQIPLFEKVSGTEFSKKGWLKLH